jgi:glycosyltransferase involved in cell wall biosynthesis
MFNGTTVSIIVPAFRHASFISKAIESALDQSFTGWEMIIINDGSPDDTKSAVEPFLDDPRIKYYEQQNMGQAASRNRGIAMARGDFIQLLDDDDLLAPDGLEWKLEYLKAHPEASCIVGGVQYIDEEGKYLGSLQGLRGTVTLRRLFKSSAFASPGQALFRHSCFDDVGLFDADLQGVDDTDFMFRLARNHRIEAVQRLALLYRWHGTNASAKKHKMLLPAYTVHARYTGDVEPFYSRWRARVDSLRGLHRYAGLPTLSYLKEGDISNIEKSELRKHYRDIFIKGMIEAPIFAIFWLVDLAKWTVLWPLRRFLSAKFKSCKFL